MTIAMLDARRVARVSLGWWAWLAVIGLCTAAISATLSARPQDQPLPDKTAFLEEAKKRLKSDDQLQGPYTYREHQLREDYDGDGRVEKRVTKNVPEPSGTAGRG